ncbi:MAG: phosphoribosylaminoimidazolesuccinocarboxamide synthase [Chthoniobacterales bacterium]
MNLLTCTLPGIKKLRSGKVREVFEVPNHDDQLLVVTTDRISAFDCILPNAIPGKGKVLNQLSSFWFNKCNFIPNHLITTDVEKYPQELQAYAEELQERSMIVKKTTPLPIECVVRGYLAGSGWNEYQRHGTLAGVPLPTGLCQAEKLPEVFFTPSTKAEEGHDEPISWEQCKKILGDCVATEVRKMSIALYEHGRDYAATHGIIIADTKFEFGLLDDKIILIDECMTPDSSRFWPMDQYVVGENPPSFDKQFLRDYLESCGWNKMPPAPELPDEIVTKTAEKYHEALFKLL